MEMYLEDFIYNRGKDKREKTDKRQALTDQYRQAISLDTQCQG
jgi:hypothetical protein